MSEQLLQILVVEDDELDRMIMKRALNGSGMKHELTFAEDHESGKTAAAKKFDYFWITTCRVEQVLNC